MYTANLSRVSNGFASYTRDISRFRDSQLTYHLECLNGKGTRARIACTHRKNVRDAGDATAIVMMAWDYVKQDGDRAFKCKLPGKRKSDWLLFFVTSYKLQPFKIHKFIFYFIYML